MPAKFFQANAALQSTLENILEETWDTFPQLAQNQIAVTWIAYEPPYQINTGGALNTEDFWKYQPSGASYRGVELANPGRLVQLFYIVAMHVWLEQGMAQSSPEIVRAMADMLTDGSNDATSYIVDVLSGTTSGPAIPEGPFETWQSQRNIMNRYFQQLGWPELRAINLNQKTWSEGPYGREREFLGKTFDNQNQLTTEAIARLLHSIIGGVSVSSKRSQAIMDLMRRVITPEEPAITGLIGASLPTTAKLWSKSSSTGSTASSSSCDAAYIETDETHPYLLVIVAEGAAKAETGNVVSFVSERILSAAQQAFTEKAPA